MTTAANLTDFVSYLGASIDTVLFLELPACDCVLTITEEGKGEPANPADYLLSLAIVPMLKHFMMIYHTILQHTSDTHNKLKELSNSATPTIQCAPCIPALLPEPGPCTQCWLFLWGWD